MAPNGAGVTVAPTAQTLGTAVASSVCSSLSSVACFDLQSASCAAYGTATTTGESFVISSSNFAARPTAYMAAAVAGVGFGIAGHLV